MRTCPVAIELIMFLYYSGNPEDYPFKGTMAGETALHDFLDADVIEEKDGVYRCTSKGKAWVELICSTPYPVIGEPRWVDPRTREDIEYRHNPSLGREF